MTINIALQTDTFETWRLRLNDTIAFANAVGSASAVTITGGSISSCAITGGSINGTTIGATSRSSGAFTTLSLNTALSIANGGTGGNTAETARSGLGLGTLAEQNSNNVSITGGSITGISPITISNGGTGAGNASDARVNLGLGNMATQNANNVAITGGSIDGVSIGTGVTGLFRDPMTAAYDIVYRDGTNISNKLAKGSAGTSLRVNNSNVLGYGGAILIEEQNASTNYKMWVGSLAQYNAIGTKDSTTLYFVI